MLGSTEMLLRNARREDLPAASKLCFRSKAFWGYDAAFMEACQAELTLSLQDLTEDTVAVIEKDERLVGVAQVSLEEGTCFLEKLFVDPDDMNQGIGRLLFLWSVDVAKQMGAGQMVIEADPQAAAFYKNVGCKPAGTAVSGSIKGRVLPRLTYPLDDALI